MTPTATTNTGERKKPRLREKYERDVIPQLMQKFSIQNRMAVPRVIKVGINMGVRKEKESKEYFDEVTKHLALLSGQRPVVTRARKSIAGFKVRENDKVGLKVTLRRDRMWEFLDRLISLAIPRLRDFRGLSRKAFDGRGNYTMGISEQTVFPEVDPDSVNQAQGMDITVVTTAADDAQAQELLLGLGMPFQAPAKQGAPGEDGKGKRRSKGPDVNVDAAEGQGGSAKSDSAKPDSSKSRAEAPKSAS